MSNRRFKIIYFLFSLFFHTAIAKFFVDAIMSLTVPTPSGETCTDTSKLYYVYLFPRQRARRWLQLVCRFVISIINNCRTLSFCHITH